MSPGPAELLVVLAAVVLVLNASRLARWGRRIRGSGSSVDRGPGSPPPTS